MNAKKRTKKVPKAPIETEKQRKKREDAYRDHLNSVSFTEEITPEEQKKFDDEDNADTDEP